MNRDDKGKALYTYLSGSKLWAAIRSGTGQKSWASLKEEVQGEYRRVGVDLAQDFIYGGKYELSLASLNEEQILYNGLFTCALSHAHYGSCHLLLLRSKHRDTEDEEHVQKLAIVAQTPTSLLAIQRAIEEIATLIMDVFKYPMYNHPHDDVTITPENTRFIEYLPYSALNDIADITEPPKSGRGSEISIVRFQWESEPDTARPFRNYKASNPGWKDTSIAAVNLMIQSL